jgi:peroxiredoxin Q/BCP
MKNGIKIAFLFIMIAGFTNLFSQSELAEGSQAPDFTLKDAFGNEYTLSTYSGISPVVIYFYPKAGTSGCTKQACAIRDDWDKFEENNIKVFGVSTDTKEEIEEFVNDYSLNFPLLSDADKKVSKDYGVLNESGKAQRVTFIIDKDNIISDILEVNDIDLHADYVFNAASKLNSSD